jgi:glycosyltransferase involved in cell wall biosynthesis
MDSAIQEYEGLCPVSSGDSALQSLAENCDVLIFWGHLDVSLPDLVHRPKVVSVCHIPPEWDNGLYKSTEGIDAFVAVSPTALEVVPKHLRDKAIVIPNALDPNHVAFKRSREQVRRQWGVDGDQIVIGYLGRLNDEKNPKAMSELAQEIKSAGLNWQVVVVGGGSITLEPTSNLKVVGPDARAGDCLSAFDWLVVPSNFESYCLSAVEAFALGVPVVATLTGVAAQVPGLARTVPIPATGQTLLKAILDDARDVDGTYERIERAQEWAAENAGIEAFGKSWSEYLAGLV